MRRAEVRLSRNGMLDPSVNTTKSPTRIATVRYE
jgi:hypothetical protein